jgi:hypothetical protein
MRTAPSIRGRDWTGGRLGAGLGLLGCVAMLTACGASSKSGGSSASRSYSQVVRFSRCMRAHGVPNFPDPTPGGGIQFSASLGISPFSPAFKTAQHACHGLLPGGLAPGKASAQQKARVLALARCMRAHGVTGLPDPVGSPPASPAGFSAIFGVPGALIEIPGTIDVKAPAFRRAAAACGFPRGG